MNNTDLFRFIMEAEGDLVEPFDAEADTGGAEPTPAPTDQAPPPVPDDDMPPPLADDSGMDDLSMGDDQSGDGGGMDGDETSEDDNTEENQQLSEKVNNNLNQALYRKFINRNNEIEDVIENINTIIPVLPNDVVKSNDVSLNRLKAALAKGQHYVLEKFVDSKYGENLLFFQQLDVLYTALLNQINKNLKKVEL